MRTANALTAAATLVAAATLGGCAAAREEARAQGAQTARAEFIDAEGRRIGEATLREGPHGVLVRLQLEGAPPGTRAIHVHERGRCTPDFDAAGGHWNPRGREHGFLNPAGWHLGDLPNLHVAADGRRKAELFLPGASISGGDSPLLDGDGSSFILHEGPDDHRTDPTGDAGGRFACAVILGN